MQSTISDDIYLLPQCRLILEILDYPPIGPVTLESLNSFFDEWDIPIKVGSKH